MGLTAEQVAQKYGINRDEQDEFAYQSHQKALNAQKEDIAQIGDIFDELGKTELIDEKLLPAATSLASCGIAYAFRYIRAAMEGGVEMGLYPNVKLQLKK